MVVIQYSNQKRGILLGSGPPRLIVMLGGFGGSIVVVVGFGVKSVYM